MKLEMIKHQEEEMKGLVSTKDVFICPLPFEIYKSSKERKSMEFAELIRVTEHQIDTGDGNSKHKTY